MWDYDRVPDIEWKQGRDGSMTAKLTVVPIPGYASEAAFKRKFEAVMKRYNLEPHRDTLLFITLLEDERIHDRLNFRLGQIQSKAALKDIVKFIDLIHSTKLRQQLSIKVVSSTQGPYEIKSESIVRWIADTMETALIDDNLTHLHTLGVNGSMQPTLNYEHQKLESMSSNKNRVHAALRGKLLATFLLNIWKVLTSGSFPPFPKSKGFGNAEYQVLYDIGVLYTWIESTPKRTGTRASNYVSKMFSEHVIRSK